jgi:hypothetical protein
MSSKTYFHGIIKLRLTDMMTKKFLTVTSPSEQLNLDDRRRIKLRWVWSIENTVTLAKADLCVRLWESMMARFSICSQFMIRFLRRGVAYIDRQDGQMDGDYYDRTYIPLIYSSTTGADDPHALLPQVGYFAPDYGVVEKSLVRISEVQVIINGEEELCISFHATDSSEHPTFKLAVSDHLAGFNWLLYGSGDLSVSEMSSFAGSTVLSTTGTSGRYYSVCIPSSDAGVDVNATLVSIQISVDMFLSDNWPFRAQYEFQDVPVSRPMHFIAKANANEGFDCKLKYHLANGEEVGYVGASSGLPDSFDVIETVDSQVIDRSAKLMTVELKVITKHPQSRRMRLRFKVFALDTSNTEAHSRVRRKRLATGHQPPKFKLLKTRPQDPRWSRDLIQTAVEMPAECALIYVEVCLVRGRLWWQRLLPIYRSPPLTVYPGDDSTINSHYIPLHTSWLSRQWMAVKRRLSKRTKQ